MQARRALRVLLVAVLMALTIPVSPALAQTPSITLAASPPSIVAGESVDLAGDFSVDDSAPSTDTVVTLQSSATGQDGEWSFEASTTALAGDGTYAFTQSPLSATLYRTLASVGETQAVSAPVLVAVTPPPPPVMTLDSSASSVTLGDSATLSGDLDTGTGPPPAGTTVTIEYSLEGTPGATWTELPNAVATADDGTYTTDVTPAETRIYRATATVDTALGAKDVVSNTVLLQVLPPPAPTITLSVSESQVVSGTVITFEGTLRDGDDQPVSGVNVAIDYSSTDSAEPSWNTLKLTPATTGSYSTDEAVTETRIYRARATVDDQEVTSIIALVEVDPAIPVTYDLSIATDASVVEAGTDATFSGVLSANPGTGDPGGPVVGAVVTVQSSANGTDWTTVDTDTTSVSGAYAVTAAASETLVYRAIATVNTTDVVSGQVAVGVIQPPFPELTLSASDSVITSGTSVTFTGDLDDGAGTPIIGTAVDLQSSPDGSAWTTIGTTNTVSPGGTYSFTYAPAASLVYRTIATVDAEPVVSGQVAVAVVPPPAASMTLVASDSSVTSGTPVGFSGLLANGFGTPAAAGTLVTIESSVDGAAWSTMTTTTAAAGGSYATTLTPAGTRMYRATAVVGAPGGPQDAVSNTVFVAVSDIPTPALTLTADPTFVTSGTPVGFAGVLLDGFGSAIDSATVTLESSVDGVAWDSVATTLTAANGSYSATDTPAATRLYRTTAAVGEFTVYSPPVLVTVVPRPTPVLTLGASASEIASGTPVRFSGVLEDGADSPVDGATVTLKSSLDGITWTTEALATTQADGSYATTLTPTQTRVYRADATVEAQEAESNVVMVSVVPEPVVTYELTLAASDQVVVAGAPVGFSGDLIDDTETPIGETTVTVEASVDGIVWSTVADVMTATDGSYATTLTVTETMLYRSTASIDDEQVFSNQVPVNVKVLVPGRIWGLDRYATSAALSQATFAENSLTNVVLASGEGFADALSASGLAGSPGVKSPVLLVTRTSVPDPIMQEIKRIARDDATVTVHLVGGARAIDDSVKRQIEAAGIAPTTQVVRWAGADRFQTAGFIAIGMHAAQSQVPGFWRGEAFLANGLNFPDALSVAPLAWSQAFPVLLTLPDALPTTTSSAMDAIALTEVVITGGTGSVSSRVEQAVDAKPGVDTARWAGSDRYATATTVADQGIARGWASDTYVGVASGETYPDALSGGAVAGSNGGVLVLTAKNSVSPATGSFLGAHRTKVDFVDVYGGPASVSEATRWQIFQRLNSF